MRTIQLPHFLRKLWARLARCLIPAIVLLDPSCRYSSGAGEEFSLSDRVPRDSFEVIGRWPHDPTQFTEGLVFDHGLLWESTGHYGASGVRQFEPETGRILRNIDFSKEYYSEGITVFQDQLFQLTYREHKAFSYDLNSLKVVKVFDYDGEGWGLTHDDSSLIMSNGTNRISFLNPADFKTVHSIDVYDAGRPVELLNELEYVKGEIYANIWRTDMVVRIDPVSGGILGVIDVGKLFPLAERQGDASAWPNGIAYDESRDRLFVTGKHWPAMFEIRVRKNQS